MRLIMFIALFDLRAITGLSIKLSVDFILACITSLINRMWVTFVCVICIRVRLFFIIVASFAYC